MNKIYKKMLVAGAAMALAGVAQAQSAGSNIVSLGWMRVMPQGHSEFLTIDSIAGRPAGVQRPNTGATIDSVDTVGLTFSHFFTDNISAEFVLGVPPEHDVSGDRGYEKYGKLGKVRQWSPAVVAKWHFFDAKTKLRPYVGIGVNYTWFTGESVTNQTFVQSEFGPGSTMTGTAKSSWNPVFNVGANYAITDRWFVGLSVSYVPISTTARFTTTLANGAKVESHTKIKIDPIVTFLNVGYRF
ncbi:OmpW/AlkL family protein [Cupriavidus agavae]|uniref:Outer membrane protein n=1 Tax=Cupriavidus agavae TaxID=1001822 RepID=A0A4Q7RWI4_9BURK|nr:OmpW family outer membrane protein [Cupriavidus agavae]RZT38351.1 outer membrane protein [Cupriavidus agavae]